MAQAASLLTVPSFLTNVWQAMGPDFLPLLRCLWPMLLGICVGTWGMGAWVGADLLTADGGARAALASEASGQRGNFFEVRAHSASEDARERAGDTRPEPVSSARASVGLGLVLALYGLLGLSWFEFSVSARWEPWLSPLIGAVTGVVTAATGVYMVPSAPYLQAIGLEKDGLVQALGLSFTVSTLALAGILVRDGSLEMSVAGLSLLALVPALIGMVLGQWVRARVRSRAFRICFFLGSLVLGAHLALRGLV